MNYWQILLTTANGVFPIIILILLGYFLKRFRFLTPEFVKIGNKFVFKVCLPCMLFINIYDNMDSFADIRWDVVLYAVTIIFLIFGLGLVTAILTTKQRNRRGVILQCTFRSNFAIIGLSLVESLGGDEVLAGIISAFSIPVFNILAVVALSIYADPEPTAEPQMLAPDAPFAEVQGMQQATAAKTKHSVKDIILNIVKNPLIIGVVLGLVFVGIRELERACSGGAVPFSFKEHLTFLYKSVANLKAIASPLALVVLGGQFEFSAVGGMTKEIIVATVWRVVITPLIGIGGAILLSKTPLFTFDASVYPTLIALFGTPVAVSSAIMAGEMRNDGQLATQLVVWTSITSIVTIFLIVFVLKVMGLS